jgi:hypothetical protein
MDSKRISIFYDENFDKEIAEFVANLPKGRRKSETFRQVLKLGIEQKAKEKERLANR